MQRKHHNFIFFPSKCKFLSSKNKDPLCQQHTIILPRQATIIDHTPMPGSHHHEYLLNYWQKYFISFMVPSWHWGMVCYGGLFGQNDGVLLAQGVLIFGGQQLQFWGKEDKVLMFSLHGYVYFVAKIVLGIYFTFTN